MSEYREFARGAIPALVIALVLVLVLQFYLPLHIQQNRLTSQPSNGTTTYIQKSPVGIAVSNYATKNSFLYVASSLLAFFLASATYFLVRRSRS
ncbi:MAG: hypothetical protein QXG05_00680 [Nitrososphaerota archaeon]